MSLNLLKRNNFTGSSVPVRHRQSSINIWVNSEIKEVYRGDTASSSSLVVNYRNQIFFLKRKWDLLDGYQAAQRINPNVSKQVWPRQAEVTGRGTTGTFQLEDLLCLQAVPRCPLLCILHNWSLNWLIPGHRLELPKWGGGGLEISTQLEFLHNGKQDLYLKTPSK